METLTHESEIALITLMKLQSNCDTLQALTYLNANDWNLNEAIGALMSDRNKQLPNHLKVYV